MVIIQLTCMVTEARLVHTFVPETATLLVHSLGWMAPVV